MSVLKLGPWKPDVSSIDSGGIVDVINVFPKGDGYGPVKGLSSVSTALPGACKGAVAVRRASGGFAFYAGTAVGLFRFDNVSGGWNDVSNPSGSYSVPEEHYWSFAQFGQLLIAVHVNDPPQFINIDSGTNFANLGGSPP